MMSSRLFKEAGLFPAAYLRPQQLLDKKWALLKKSHSLPDRVKERASELISNTNLEGRAPESIVAASIYLAITECGLSSYITQREVASEFGITEVSVRNVARAFQANMEGQQQPGNGSEGGPS